jgi:heptosyltransferase-3
VPTFDLSGQLSLKELAALAARARLFVGVDSAPMHIAAAMGTPTVAIFGPSGDREWGPWQTQSRVVTSLIHECRPCGRAGCNDSKISECLTTLPVAQVLAACEELLA